MNFRQVEKFVHYMLNCLAAFRTYFFVLCNYFKRHLLFISHLLQCCIDDDIGMLKFIVRQGGDVNSIDNEGWTPLHAAASCNFMPIVK